ncbi:tRNA pseudouridine(13) synthase TruD [Methylomonas sp. LL1]|uniref:tRNA pseudouridine(13) synthase TruD n=1 Tax=Methylomonas sp. LL1 TaxID=2785785 RepID=UPI0018C439D0|nr:tRNA pseudouridine(13) synthase TruD [Methylomonas sp. LL1]QPK61526.1 tRNA pseudouridine(13) synthase TruD [Methylomonas sp. LL1]
MTDFSLPIWPYAYGGPTGHGDIKTFPNDFIVEEFLSFAPEGSGEHVFLHIEKVGENTEYVARLLARHAGVRQRDVSYAGMKDRHGRTRQWFSVWLPGKQDIDWSGIESDHLKILQSVRHARKLKRGVLAGNRFTLTIRNWQGDRDVAEQQLQQIQQHGFPNYFGEQRFGHQGRNIEKALAMFQGGKVKREQRSIYLSAVRSYLFNLILAERVKAQTWNKVLPGDVFKLNKTNSYFHAEAIDQALLDRLESGDIHATGALWGKGDSGVTTTMLALERQIIEAYPELADGLLKADLEADRRALRIIPENLAWQFEPDENLRLSFGLPAGSYATALLREIVQTSSV